MIYMFSLIINNKIFNINIFPNCNFQYLKAKKHATPAFTHTSSISSDANSSHITKLVECPVVLNVPALDTTLYLILLI